MAKSREIRANSFLWAFATRKLAQLFGATKTHETELPVTRYRTNSIKYTNVTDPFVFSMYAIAVLGFAFLIQLDIEGPRNALRRGEWVDLLIWTAYFCVIFSPYLLAEYLDWKFPRPAPAEQGDH